MGKSALKCILPGVLFLLLFEIDSASQAFVEFDLPYIIVDTGQEKCFDAFNEIACPKPQADFYGQDAQYKGLRSDYGENGDGTVRDKVTGLMWLKGDSATLNAGRKKDGMLNWADAMAYAESLEYAGYDDWRLPNAKELHRIVDYTRSPDTTDSAGHWMFITA